MGSREKVDRLSNMPDDVISHILSLMPTEYAVQTCVLSKSWIHTWKSVTNLDFDDDEHPFHDMDRFITFVDRALECCKAPQIKLFRLHCSWIHGSNVCVWIDAPVRLNVYELDVKVRNLVLPHSLFTCKTLTKLRLRTRGRLKYDPSYHVINLPCLKTIDIKVINDKTFVIALNIIRGSPVLERLSLKIYNSTIKEYNFNIPSLKHMDLTIIKKLETHSYKVVLNVPKLEDLIVITDMSTVFVMEDLSSLISVTLSYHNGCYPLSVEIFKGISGAKSLTLDVHALPKTSSDITIPNFRSSLKHLVFSGLDWPLFHQIVEISPELEHLCITMNPKDQKNSCWIAPQSVPTCMLNNLRAMTFVNFRGRKTYLEFLAYLLANAKVLMTLTIKFESMPLKEEMQLRAELLMLPKASRYCKIHFLGSRSRSTTS